MNTTSPAADDQAKAVAAALQTNPIKITAPWKKPVVIIAAIFGIIAVAILGWGLYYFIAIDKFDDNQQKRMQIAFGLYGIFPSFLITLIYGAIFVLIIILAFVIPGFSQSLSFILASLTTGVLNIAQKYA